MRHRDTKQENAVGKMHPVDLLEAGLTQTFSLEKKTIISAKHNKANHNKMRCACTIA